MYTVSKKDNELEKCYSAIEYLEKKCIRLNSLRDSCIQENKELFNYNRKLLKDNLKTVNYWRKRTETILDREDKLKKENIGLREEIKILTKRTHRLNFIRELDIDKIKEIVEELKESQDEQLEQAAIIGRFGDMNEDLKGLVERLQKELDTYKDKENL